MPRTPAGGASLQAVAEPTTRALERFPNAPPRLHFIQNELELLAMQVSEIQECCEGMLPVVAPHHDAERDLYHLSARLEGVLWQLEEMMQVSERLLHRPLRGGPGPTSLLPSGSAATPAPAAETAPQTLIAKPMVCTHTDGEGVVP